MKKNKLFNLLFGRVKFLLPKNNGLRYLCYFLSVASSTSIFILMYMYNEEKNIDLFYAVASVVASFLQLVYPLLLVRSCIRVYKYGDRNSFVANSFFKLLIRTLICVIACWGHVLMLLFILYVPGALIFFLQDLMVKFTGIIYFDFLFVLYAILAIFLSVSAFGIFIAINLFYKASYFAKFKLFFQLFNLHKFKLFLIFILCGILFLFAYINTVLSLFSIIILVTLIPALIVTLYKNLRAELDEKQNQLISGK